MKKLFRMFVFSAFALFLTSLWNKGFVLDLNVSSFLTAVILLVVAFYVVLPISKVVLLPLNLLSFGLVSFILYIFILHMGASGFHVFSIHPWQFGGLHISFISIPSQHISYLGNLILCSLSISGIINVLEQLT